jgi:hypothetical protein
VLRRAFDRFSGLNLARKVLAALLVALLATLLLFSLSFFISTATLNLLGAGERTDPPIEEGAAPQTASAGSSAGAEATAPRYTLSVSGKPSRWWDRSVETQMGWSERIFAQEFVAAEGSEGGEPLDRGASHAVRCSARFSGGWQVSDGARVEGTPPG